MFKLSLILFILEPPRAQSRAPKTLRPIPAVFQDEGTSVVGEYRAVYSTTQLCFLPDCFGLYVFCFLGIGFCSVVLAGLELPV